MLFSVGTTVFYVVLALLLLTLPGLALLRLAGGPLRTLDCLSRFTIAPGITTALTVLIFVWCKLVRLQAGPVLPWLVLTISAAILVFVRENGFSIPRWKDCASTIRQISAGQLFGGLALLGIITILFGVRFRAVWDWCVPPGVDTAQHTVITQLLIEHGGLFSSWAPYADAETFTYHFGFHSVAAMFAWLSGLDAVRAVLVTTRVFQAVAAASLVSVVRLWVRNAWGGIFATVLWLIYSNFLFNFDLNG